ncbi:MAG: Blue-light-activated protein [Syntrophorhabdus sp. PtaB.Bin006]|nr:MAG: Blue-light-activated protein [Syntrophorhabdus sp. PtaB.Bin006]
MIRFLSWRHFSIKEKLILISLITTGSALFLAGAIFVTGEILAIRQSEISYLNGLAGTIARNSVPILTAGEHKASGKILEALGPASNVTCAILYDGSGKVIAEYHKNKPCPPMSGQIFRGDTQDFGLIHIDFLQHIKQGQNTLGTIHLKSHTKGISSVVMGYATTLIVIMGCSFLLAYVLFSNLQNAVTRHLYDLADLMGVASRNKDYSVRAAINTEDEVGILSQGFNEMLDNIQARDGELDRYRQRLETLVEERTTQLLKTNEQLHSELRERTRVEKALQESEYRYRTIFDTAGSANAILENDSTIVMVNDAFTRLTGYSKDEVEGNKVWTEFVLKEDLEKAKAYHHSKKTNPDSTPNEYEVRIVNREGNVRNAYVSLALVPGTTRSIASLLDITDIRDLQAQLFQSQKMEAIGELAGGVSHDINNILTIIMGYGSLLLMKMDPKDSAKSYVENILSSAEKATNLTQSLLAFSRRQVITPKHVELNTIIKDVEKLLLRVIGEDIDLKTTLTKNKAYVFADPNQMGQVLLNLAANARDAMPHGGSLIIRTDIIQADETLAARIMKGKTGTYALISVTDTGVGMVKEDLDRIFEPFFTTKEEGKGSGLGLSIVYGAITQHGGYVDVESESNRGTTFRMYLPIVSAREGRSRAKTPESLARGSETVLVAEDNEAVRILVRNILAEQGYGVMEAVDGDDAVRKFKDNPSEISLLLFDVVMPKKNGKRAYNEIRTINSDIKALFMSGYTVDVVNSHGVFEKEARIIYKPIVPPKLLSAVREILDSR